MKGEIFMNPKIIKVELLELDSDTDVLRFQFIDEPIDVNLNSQDCQNSLKIVFSTLLNTLVKDDFSLELEVSEGYSRGMYIEVCTEYINDLNRELNEIKEELREAL